MKPLQLTLAMGDYDHIRDLASGVVRAAGIELRYLDLPLEEIFFRFIKHREWDISEMSFGKFVSLASQGDRSFVGIPVFPSRVFRLSSFYVREGGRVQSPADLAAAVDRRGLGPFRHADARPGQVGGRLHATALSHVERGQAEHP